MNPQSGRARLAWLAIAALYIAVAGWFVLELHRPDVTPITFRELGDFHRKDTGGNETIKTHAYLRWSEGKADQQRMGVTKHDVDATSPGYVLFTDDRRHALLMDNTGAIVWSWKWPGAKWLEYAVVRPDGDLLGMSVGQGICRLDKQSNVRWSHQNTAHHEIAIDLDGRVIVPVKRFFDWGQADPRTRRRICLDELEFFSPQDGKLVASWTTARDFEALRTLHGPSPAESGKEDDFYHLNSVQVLPETDLGRRDPRFKKGNYLLCFRNVDLVLILDRETMKPVWHWGPGELDYPHMPRLLANGRILIYDNGPHRKKSRLIELDPVTKAIEWTYASSDFYSGFRGSSQRLPNGNTFVCQADTGRLFEIDPAGNVVWEFWNPILNEGGRRRGIYRAERVPPALVAGFLDRGPRWGVIAGAAVPALLLLGLAFRPRKAA